MRPFRRHLSEVARAAAAIEGGGSPATEPATSRELVSLLGRLAFLRARVSMLWIRREGLRTLQGRCLLLLLLVAAPSLWELARAAGGPLPPGLRGTAGVGALVLAQIGLTLTFVLLVPLQLYRDFVVRGKEEPLLAHPWTLPALTVLKVGTGILWTTGYLLAFYYLFHLSLLTTADAGGLRAVGLHALGSVSFYFTVGILLARGTFTLLRRADPVWLRRITALLFLPFLVLFSVTAVLPGVLATRTPRFLADFGSRIADALFLLQIPVALVHAPSAPGRIGWGVLLLIGPLLGARWLVGGGWRPGALSMLSLDGEGDRPIASGFAHLLRRSPSPHPFRLFLRKDVLLPLRRRPIGYLAEQGPILTGGILSFFALTQALEQGLLSPLAGELLAPGIPMIAVGALALFRGLPALGSERGMLPLLQPILSPGRLLAVKWCTQVAYLIPHALTFAVFGSLAAASLVPAGIRAIPMAGVQGVLSGLLLSLLATAIGFLLPGSRGGDGPLSGASIPGVLLYSLTAATALVGWLALRVHFLSGSIGAVRLVAFNGVISALLLAFAAVAGAWAVRRLHRELP